MKLQDDCATSYLKCDVQGYRAELGDDSRLPLSNQSFIGDAAARATALTGLAAAECSVSLWRTLRRIRELSMSLREGLFMDPCLVPTMVPVGQRLNAYALDFYTHGQLHAIRTENWIEEPYDTLLDFCLIIKALSRETSVHGPR